MSKDDDDQVLNSADVDELADSPDAYLAAISELFTEWLSETDCAAYDDL